MDTGWHLFCEAKPPLKRGGIQNAHSKKDKHARFMVHSSHLLCLLVSCYDSDSSCLCCNKINLKKNGVALMAKHLMALYSQCFKGFTLPSASRLVGMVLLTGLLTVGVSGCQKASDMGALSDSSPEAQLVDAVLPAGNADEAVITVTSKNTKTPYTGTREELALIMRSFAKTFQLASNPKAKTDKNIQQTLLTMGLNKLIFLTLINAELKQRNITITPEILETYRKEQIDTMGGQDKFDKLLAEKAFTEGEMTYALTEKVKLDKLTDALSGSEIKVTDAELQKLYNENKKQFQEPEKLDVRHLLVKFNPNQVRNELKEKQSTLSDADLKAKVEEAKKAAEAKIKTLNDEVQKTPERLAALAQAQSDDTGSQKAGGKIEGLVQQTTDPSFWDAATKLSENGVTKAPVQSVFGWHIIQLLKKHPAGIRPLDNELKLLLKNQVLGQKRTPIIQKWTKDVQAAYDFTPNKKYAPSQVGGEAPPAGKEAAKPEAKKP
jgi:parvulin-like peptidyl-prolyl isomerase